MTSPKTGWNWKTHLLAFVTGMVVGRVAKSSPSHAHASARTEPDPQDEVEALLLVFGVMKELSAALDLRLTADDVKESFERAWHRSAAVAGEPSAEDESFFRKRFLPLLLQSATSAIPSVPPVVRPEIYAIVDDLLPLVKEKAASRLPEMTAEERAALAQEIRRVRHGWENEHRSAPYIEISRRIESVVETLPTAG
ncbi:MAG: hypothetical protein M3O61_02585 [Gemmatimonadota bacterium]|nr:hypothetical protein [Gemmatimonadota bacterium]